jgi:phenylalanyl-tRNA synthetase alpha chain
MLNVARDAMTNINHPICAKLNANLLRMQNHPLAIINNRITNHFATNYPTKFKPLLKDNPIVSVFQNFDSLLIDKSHPSRAKTDTYYLNKHKLLRTHSSAHQFDTLASKESNAYLISADVYRRDEIDRIVSIF